MTGSFDVSRDGQRLYLLRFLAPPVDIPHVVLNWSSLLTTPR
jgi:hypothetical protein